MSFVYICNINQILKQSVMNKTTFLKSNLAIYILWIVSFIVVASFFIFIEIVFYQDNGHKVVSKGGSISSASYKDTLKPIDEEIPTSLPYYKYNRLKDSINYVRYLKNGANRSAVFSPFGGAMSLQFVMNKDIDHKKSRFDQFSIEALNSYFYIIKGWKMKSNENLSFGDYTYYVENGVPYFRKYVLKSIKGTHSNMEMTEKRLNYFYEKNDKIILIQISKNTYTFAQFTSIFLMFVFAFFSLVSVLLAFKILYNISRGKVFIEENIKMLRQATFITILIPLLFILISLCQKLIFYQYFDDNVVLNIDFYKVSVKSLFVGLAVSILYSVFKRGFNIQQENDLVV